MKGAHFVFAIDLKYLFIFAENDENCRIFQVVSVILDVFAGLLCVLNLSE